MRTWPVNLTAHSYISNNPGSKGMGAGLGVVIKSSYLMGGGSWGPFSQPSYKGKSPSEHH